MWVDLNETTLLKEILNKYLALRGSYGTDSRENVTVALSEGHA